MTIDKLEFKLNVINDIGNKVEDFLENSKTEKDSYSGAKEALVEVIKRFENNLNLVDKEVESLIISIEEATLIKKWCLQYIEITKNLLISVNLNLQQSFGKIQANEQVVKYLKTIHTNEELKKELILSPKDENKRITGEHPGNPLALRKIKETNGNNP